MKKILILLMLSFSGCKLSTYIFDGVDQHVESDCNGITTSQSCIMTIICKDENIVWSSYININASKKQIDSVKAEADSIYSRIKNL